MLMYLMRYLGGATICTADAQQFLSNTCYILMYILLAPDGIHSASSPRLLGPFYPSIFHNIKLLLCGTTIPPNIPPSPTAKLSSPILLPRTVSYDATSKPPRQSGPYRGMSEQQKTGRRRRSSSLIYQEPPETIEHMSDQAALPNLNADWVNAKGQLLRSVYAAYMPDNLVYFTPALLYFLVLTYIVFKVLGRYT
jgi:hypothetical protein